MFKDEYRKKLDSKQRDVMLRSKIFPSMFNHWNMTPDSMTEEEKSCRLKVSPHKQLKFNLSRANTGHQEMDDK